MKILKMSNYSVELKSMQFEMKSFMQTQKKITRNLVKKVQQQSVKINKLETEKMLTDTSLHELNKKLEQQEHTITCLHDILIRSMIIDETTTIQVPPQLLPEDPTQDPTQDPPQDPIQDPPQDPPQDPNMIPPQDPNMIPTQDPNMIPTQDPTQDPNMIPPQDPNMIPTQDPNMIPTQDPTQDPPQDPNMIPTQDPTQDPPQDPNMIPPQDPNMISNIISNSPDRMETENYAVSIISELISYSNSTNGNTTELFGRLNNVINILNNNNLLYNNNYENSIITTEPVTPIPVTPRFIPPQGVEIPNEFLCPITLEIMQEPVIASDGNTYERSAIIQYMNMYPDLARSPLNREVLERNLLIQNNNLLKMIEDFCSLPASG